MPLCIPCFSLKLPPARLLGLWTFFLFDRCLFSPGLASDFRVLILLYIGAPSIYEYLLGFVQRTLLA